MIHFSCSRCGQKFKVKPDFAGRSTTCPACKQALVVPQPDVTAAYVPNDKIEGLQSSVVKAGIDGGVTLATEPVGAARSGQKSVKELLAGRERSGERYLVEGEIARGGMGAVLRAIDCDIRREVAVKYLLKQADPRNKARFVEEAQITGQLEHPNIAPVHELGVDSQKRVFFAMKMVRGRSLGQVLGELRNSPKSAEKAWPMSRLLTVFVSICNALDYAHARGVIHRDLKPANVMVGDFGEVYVMDWGLAKVLDATSASAVPAPVPGAGSVSGSSAPGKIATSRDADADLTQEGAVLGTPAYMPPEQAMGKIDAVDRRSDIYSLAAILYEILTLQTPVDREGGYLSILMRVTEGAIQAPEALAPRRAIPKELSAIVMKGLAKLPQDRYQTVEAFRKDIERFQAGRSVSAKDDTTWELLWKFVKRNKGFSAGAVMTGTVLLFGVFFLARAYADLRIEKQKRMDQGRDSVPSLVRAGHMLVNEGRFEDAITQTDVIRDFDPKAADIHRIRGHARIGQLRYADAAAELVIYAQAKPDDRKASALAELCKRLHADNSTELLALATELNSQNLLGPGDTVMRVAEKLVKTREEMLPVYRKRIDTAWPGLGHLLGIEPHGFVLNLEKCEQVRNLVPLKGMPLVRLNLYLLPHVRDLSPLQDMPLTELDLSGTNVRDVSPLQGMKLTWLSLGGLVELRDLTPLKGMPLTDLTLAGCPVQDLSSLKDMPLSRLSLHACANVRDLSPLKGMPLNVLNLDTCRAVHDLSPLRGMPLTSIDFVGCDALRDLSPLEGMNLTQIRFPSQVDKGMAAVKRMKTLKTINGIAAEDFWKQYEAGKFPELKP